ncbi:hypothetical protein BA190_09720 [Labrys sp. WJW]|uniref:DUF1444 family protein n=1 Tax=Labrys sp. WJW TaxID=1737983 RepID=UPI0008358AB6|nr:DUF1444 family protein [Labrys sp. WJW]OCC05181.1 hypothetical protein BA190_09720 [Labrys sp. WJW]
MAGRSQGGIGRRRVLQAMLGLAVAGPTAAGAAERFREEVVALLRRRRPGLKFTLPGDDPESIHVKVGEDTMQVYLGNLQRELGTVQGADRESQILAFFDRIRTARPADDEERRRWQDARAKLRLQLVPIEYRQQAKELVSRDLAAKVLIAYALDQGERYALVTTDDLKTWGVDADAVHEAALAGLEAVSGKLVVEAEKSAKGRGAYATILTNDGYDAARLLLPSVRQKLLQALGSDLAIAGIPNRDFLVAWTPDFSARADFAAKVSEDSKSRSHPLTDELFVIEANGFRVATAAELVEQRRI